MTVKRFGLQNILTHKNTLNSTECLCKQIQIKVYLKADVNSDKLLQTAAIFFTNKLLSETGYLLGVCRGGFHLHGLPLAARSGIQIYKMKNSSCPQRDSNSRPLDCEVLQWYITVHVSFNIEILFIVLLIYYYRAGDMILVLLFCVIMGLILNKAIQKNKTNHPISSSHPSATANIAKHYLKRGGGYETNGNII